MSFKKLIGFLIILLLLLLGWEFGTNLIQNDNLLKTPSFLGNLGSETNEEKIVVTSEESLVIDVVEKVGPSVVTIALEEPQVRRQLENFGPFQFFFEEEPQAEDEEPTERDIGSGFFVSEEGIVVTNKHVVAQPGITYLVFDNEGNRYEVEDIFRDPLNDIAILQINKPPSKSLPVVDLGDSSKLQVGQMAIAIGTALGEFRNTVTTGVISGLGRGITAGSPFQGFVERLDNVIQTDAAISPGNSGGPLLNSSGQVIGVNTAVSNEGENIGFAIPINTVKDSLENFNETGRFERPFLGISYTEVNEREAAINDIPTGALVQEVVPNSAAEDAGIRPGDIITKIDGESVSDTAGHLAGIISKKKIGDEISLEIYRDGENVEIGTTLKVAPEE